MNILLVDDEYLIREKLKKYLNTSSFSIGSISEASNGVDALNIIRNQSIDIALLDIHMPLLTGIDLVKKLREEHYDTKIIFITGFEKFEYARQAIQYNIIEYLLKPVKKDELYCALKKCINLINSEKKNLLVLNEIEEKEKHQFLIDLLYGYSIYTGSPLNVNKGNFIVVSIDLNNISSVNSIYNFLDNNFSTYDVLSGFSKTSKILIINYDTSINIQNLFKPLIDNRTLSYCYFSNINNDIKDLKILFFESLTKFPAKIFFNKYSIIDSNDIKYEKSILPNTLQLDFKLLTKSQSSNNILEKLDYYLKEIEKYKDINSLKLLLTDFLISLENISSNDSNYLSIINIDYVVNNLLYSSDNLDEIKLYCHNYYNNIIKSSKITKSTDSIKTVAKVKIYIDENYTSESINLDFLSNMFYINSCHLSSTFKKVTGQSLIEYITKKRINQAKILIKNDEFKVGEVAEKVGYKDYYYFSKIFKKHVGIPPLKYKQT